MGLTSIFIVYQLLQTVALPVVIVYLLLRPLMGKSSFGNFFHRIGFVPKANKGKKIFWIHAVSVGEVLSTQSLIKDIKNIPNALCYLTTGTTSGRKMAKKLSADYVSLMPFDFLFPMQLAFRRIKPHTIIVVEAELWPNFLMLAHRKKIPIYSINARISTRSHGRYKRFKSLLVPLINIFKKIYVQSIDDEFNFKELGVPSNKLSVLGNLKVINVLDKQAHIKPATYSPKAPVILVGSIHPGELRIYLNLYSTIKKELPNLKLILAPRHFHWKKKLVTAIKKASLTYTLWDEKTANEDISMALEKDILLICKLGVLFDLYSVADLFCLGGTFVPIGGHNLLEPAVWKKASIVGPYYHNCRVVANQLEYEGGLIKASSERELIRKARYLIKKPNLTLNMGIKANKWLKKDAIIINQKLSLFLKVLKNT